MSENNRKEPGFFNNLPIIGDDLLSMSQGSSAHETEDPAIILNTITNSNYSKTDLLYLLEGIRKAIADIDDGSNNSRRSSDSTEDESETSTINTTTTTKSKKRSAKHSPGYTKDSVPKRNKINKRLIVCERVEHCN